MKFVVIPSLSLLFVGLLGCSSPSVVKESAPTISVLSNWVMPLRPQPRFDLLPFERSKPILLGEILYAADQQGRVVAIHRSMGFLFWQTKVPAAVSGAFAYGRSKLIVGDRQGNLTALNARDGSPAWTFKAQAEWLSPAVAIANKIVALDSAGDLYALDENTGKEKWHYNRRGDEKMTVWGSGGPAVFGKTEVFQGFSDGYLVALQAETGKVIWEKRLRTRERFYDIDMTPYVDEKRVVAASYDGRLYSLDRLTGETQWVFPVGSYAGFLVEGDRLYFAGVNHQFYCIDLSSGQPVWTVAYDGGVGATPMMVNGSLVIPTSSDPIYILDPKNGKTQAKISLGAGALSSVVALPEERNFFAFSNYANLYSFELQ